MNQPNSKEYLILYDEKDDAVFEADWDDVLYIRRLMMTPERPERDDGMIAIGYSAGIFNKRTEPGYIIFWKNRGKGDYVEIRAVRYVRKTRDDVVVHVDEYGGIENEYADNVDEPQIEGETQPSAPPLVETTA